MKSDILQIEKKPIYNHFEEMYNFYHKLFQLLLCENNSKRICQH